MPGYDRTGPNGEGPKTGRNLGYCGPNKDIIDNKSNDEMDSEIIYGRGRGGFPRGGGRGFGRGQGLGQGRYFRANYDPKEDNQQVPGGLERRMGSGLGPCGDGRPRGGGRGFGGGRFRR